MQHIIAETLFKFSSLGTTKYREMVPPILSLVPGELFLPAIRPREPLYVDLAYVDFDRVERDPAHDCMRIDSAAGS